MESEIEKLRKENERLREQVRGLRSALTQLRAIARTWLEETQHVA